MSVSSSHGLTSSVTTDCSRRAVSARLRPARGTHLGDRLGLLRLLGVVRGDALGLDALGLGVVLVVVPEEVDLLLLLLGGRRGRGRGGVARADEGLARGARARERAVLRGVRGDVLVPARGVRGRGRVGCGAERLEDVHVRLRGGVAEARISKQDIQIRDPWRSES